MNDMLPVIDRFLSAMESMIDELVEVHEALVELTNEFSDRMEINE